MVVVTAVSDKWFGLQVIDDDDALRPHLLKLGQHFASLNDFSKAEKLYLKGGMYNEAIQMYNLAGTYYGFSSGLDLTYSRPDGLAVLVVRHGSLGNKWLKYGEIYCMAKVTAICHTHINYFFPQNLISDVHCYCLHYFTCTVLFLFSVFFTLFKPIFSDS